MSKPHSPRIDDVEVLRAIAVLFTIGGHVKYLLTWGNNTLHTVDLYFGLWTGVDLFFAISGFVIARDLLGRLEADRDADELWRSIFSFWTRRVYRIWPTSWFWASVLVLGALIFRQTGYWGHFRQALADFSTIVMQVANIHFWDCQTNGNKEGCGLAGSWWSLALEEQFYLLLPLAVLAFRKKLPYVLGALVLVQIFIPRPVWSLLWTLRTDAIALGVLLAIFARYPIYRLVEPTFLEKREYAIPTVCLLVFLLAELPFNWDGKINPVPFSTGLIALVSIALVFIASYDKDYIARNRYIKGLFLWLGTRSYGLYLIHMVAMYITMTIWWYASPRGTVFGPTYTLRYLVTWIAFLLSLAELNYRLIETPLRNRGKEIAKRFKPRSYDDGNPADAADKEYPTIEANPPLRG